MKRILLIFAVTGLLAALAGCGGGSIPAEKLADTLGKLKANTADTPHTVKFDNTVNISAKGGDINKTVQSEGKYVILDLSECSVKDNTIDEDNPFRADNEFITGIILPKSLTTIGEDAFDGRGHLMSVTIPASVTSIGGEWSPKGAFGGCGKLAKITVAAGNPAFSSADGVLFNKDKTALLLFPAGKGGDYTIPSSVTSIGVGAFSQNSLTSMTIPDSVTSIGNSAFASCSSLTSITIPDSVTSIGTSAFFRCSSLTGITIPGSVTSIGDRAFEECSSLSSVTISNGITSIGEEAFSGCSSLASITLPGSVTSIRDRAFEECGGLSSVTISDGITSIGERAFFQCSGFASITIPGSVTSIGKDAFAGCRGLSSVTFASGSAITRDNFGRYAFNVKGGGIFGYDPAEYGLRDAYLAGGAGTYTLAATGRGTWTKQ